MARLILRLPLSLLTKSVITPSTQERCLWISPIFIRINKEGSSHLILNLECLNNYIAHLHFKMESHTDVLNTLKPGVWMTSVDLYHAYYSRAPTINIHACPIVMPKLLCFLRRFWANLLPIYKDRTFLCDLY